jgi:hypothetical protein
VGGGIATLGAIAFGRRRKKQQPQSLTEALRTQLAEAVGALGNR